MCTSSGQDWVDEATLEERNIDSLAGHEVNEIFVSDLKFVLVGKTHVFHDSLGLEFTKSNPYPQETARYTFFGDELGGK